MRQVALRSLTRAEQRAIDNELSRRRAAENSGPTPETLRKLRPDSIDTLRRSRIIDDAQAADMHRIARAVRLIASPVALRTAGLMYIDNGKTAGNLADADVQALSWYRRWWDDLAVHGRRMAWTVVYAVAVDGLSLRDVQTAYGMGRTRAKVLLLYGLDAYAAVKRRRLDETSALTYHLG